MSSTEKLKLPSHCYRIRVFYKHTRPSYQSRITGVTNKLHASLHLVPPYMLHFQKEIIKNFYYSRRSFQYIQLPIRNNCLVMSCSFLLLIVPARSQYMICGCTNTVRLCVSTTGLQGKIKFIVLRII
jgi:hypothetical protein